MKDEKGIYCKERQVKTVLVKRDLGEEQKRKRKQTGGMSRQKGYGTLQWTGIEERVCGNQGLHLGNYRSDWPGTPA